MLAQMPMPREELFDHNHMVSLLKIATPIILALSGGLAIYFWKVAGRRDTARIVGAITLAAGFAAGGTYYWLVGRYAIPERPPENLGPPGFGKLNKTKLLARTAIEASLAGRNDESKKLAGEVLLGVEAILAEVSPSHPFGLSARLLKAQAHRLNGEPKLAGQVLDELLTEPTLTRQPSGIIFEGEIYTHAILERAELLLAEKRFAEAVPQIKACEKIPSFDKHDLAACGHYARFGLGTFYSRLGEYDKSRAVYARIMDRFEGPEKAWANQARSQITDLERTLPKESPIVDAKAQSVSGVLAGKTIWSRENGPYHVTQSIEVPASGRLEIGPGTLIRFAEGTHLLVKGTLQASGGAAEAEQIRFTALDARRGAFGWGGVRIDAGAKAEPSVLTGIRVDGADFGLSVHAGRLTVRDSLFTNCGRAGVRITVAAGSAPKSDPATDAEPRVVLERVASRGNLGTGIEFRGVGVSAVLSDCRVEKNEEFGVLLAEQADPEIRGCRIEHNGEDGAIVLRGSRGRFTGKTQLSHNGGVGIRIDSRCNTELSTATVAENVEGGVAVNDSELRLLGCTIRANRGPGVRLTLNAVAAIRESTIRDNVGTGLRVEVGCKQLTLMGSTLTANDVGVWIAEPCNMSITGNDFSANRTAALHTESANAVDACDNFWGPTTAAEIRKLVTGPAKATAAVKVEPFRSAKP